MRGKKSTQFKDSGKIYPPTVRPNKPTLLERGEIMDSENTNKACYESELQFVSQLITALEYIVRVCDEHPMRYPFLIADMTCLIHGRVCKLSDGDKILVNGLIDQIQEMYETLERLELEVLYEGGSDGEEPVSGTDTD